MMAVVLRRVVVLRVEGHGVGGWPVHHGRRRRGSAVHHVAHSAGVRTVGAARSGRVQRNWNTLHRQN